MNMKKIFLSLFVLSFFFAKGQDTCTSDARQYVNTNITQNGIRTITGTKLNVALNKILNAVDCNDSLTDRIYVQTDSATVVSYEVLNSQNAPPGSPATGDTYLVGTSPTGAWVGHAKDIAEWNGSAWVFTDGVQGDFLYNATNALTYIFRSGNWVQTTGIPALNNGNTISSGLRIGTNNARSLTFETNNVNRGRFDSVGRFYVYDTSLRKANKYLQIDSITGRLVASEISGSSASSSLFPNGGKLVETDRAVQADDAGYALLLSDGVQLTIPTICPLSPGQYFGISTNSATASFILEGNPSELAVYLSYAGQGAALVNEVVTYVAADIGGSTSLILLTQIAGSNDTVMTANRYFFEQSQNAIPLSGTEVGSPVTGDIEMGGIGSKQIYAGDLVSDFTSIIINKDDLITKIQSKVGSDVGELIVESGGVAINNNNSASYGLKGIVDFSANITDLDYTQKKYVDNRISDTATQIRSEIPNVSGFATITNLADTSTALRSLISAKISTTTLTDSLAKKTNKLISFSSYTTSDTLRLTDADKVIEMNVGTANNLVIPTNTAYAFPVGTQIVLIQIGAGQTTFVPASGVTVSSAGGKLKLTGQYSGATIIKKGTNEWYLFGDITN